MLGISDRMRALWGIALADVVAMRWAYWEQKTGRDARWQIGKAPLDRVTELLNEWMRRDDG